MTAKASIVINKSPRKTRLIVNPIRGMKLDMALLSVRTMNKEKTKPVYELLRTAANNNKISESEYSLFAVKSIVVEEAQRLYRVMPRARGSASRIRRRYSRVKVELDRI